MPQVKTVSVTYERKFNLGDFNSATISCTLWANIVGDSSLHDEMSDLWSMAKENVRAQAAPLVKKANGSMTVETFFLGLKVRDDIKRRFDPETGEIIDYSADEGLEPRSGIPFGDKQGEQQ